MTATPAGVSTPVSPPCAPVVSIPTAPTLDVRSSNVTWFRNSLLEKADPWCADHADCDCRRPRIGLRCSEAPRSSPVLLEEAVDDINVTAVGELESEPNDCGDIGKCGHEQLYIATLEPSKTLRTPAGAAPSLRRLPPPDPPPFGRGDRTLVTTLPGHKARAEEVARC